MRDSYELHGVINVPDATRFDGLIWVDATIEPGPVDDPFEFAPWAGDEAAGVVSWLMRAEKSKGFPQRVSVRIVPGARPPVSAWAWAKGREIFIESDSFMRAASCRESARLAGADRIIVCVGSGPKDENFEFTDAWYDANGVQYA